MLLVKPIAFIFLCATVITCTTPKLDPVAQPNYIAEQKQTVATISENEKRLGATVLEHDSSSAHYSRITDFDSLALTITYTLRNDAATSIKYSWNNLPGHKPELEKRLHSLIALLEKRTEQKAKTHTDSNRLNGNLSTRIEFEDTYTWQPTARSAYTATLIYFDSGRAGQSGLVLQLDFE